jgi:hypothetical protein
MINVYFGSVNVKRFVDLSIISFLPLEGVIL